MRIALDPRDEGATQPVYGEGAGHPAGFAPCDIGGDLLIGDVGEFHHRARGAQRLPGLVVAADQHEMACVQYALAAPHSLPLSGRGLDGAGFAVGAALELQHGVTGHENRLARHPLGHELSLRGRSPQREPDRLRIGDQGFVHVAGVDLGIQAGPAQQLQAGGRFGGEYETHRQNLM